MIDRTEKCALCGGVMIRGEQCRCADYETPQPKIMLHQCPECERWIPNGNCKFCNRKDI